MIHVSPGLDLFEILGLEGNKKVVLTKLPKG